MLYNILYKNKGYKMLNQIQNQIQELTEQRVKLFDKNQKLLILKFQLKNYYTK